MACQCTPRVIDEDDVDGRWTMRARRETRALSAERSRRRPESESDTNDSRDSGTVQKPESRKCRCPAGAPHLSLSLLSSRPRSYVRCLSPDPAVHSALGLYVTLLTYTRVTAGHSVARLVSRSGERPCLVPAWAGRFGRGCGWLVGLGWGYL